MTRLQTDMPIAQKPPRDEESREKRLLRVELERLREILEGKRPPQWTAWEASWYLIGILPRASELTASGTELPYYVWLPGASKRFNPNSTIRSLQIEDWHGFVSAFCMGESRTPREWISYADAKGHVAPWLEVACSDPVCRPLLPPAILKKYSPKGSGETPQSKGGYARRDGDETCLAMLSIMPDIDAFLAKFRRDPNTGRRERNALARFASDMALQVDEAVTKEAIENKVRTREKELAASR